MNLFGGMIGRYLPDADIRYVWHVEWLYEDEQSPPHQQDHADPKEALNHMIAVWNHPSTLVHLSISRRNA